MLPCGDFELPPLPTFEKHLKGFLTATFVWTGLILNFFSLIILQKLKNRSKIHRYLQGLAIWDNVLLINGFFVHCLPVLLYGKPVLTGNFIYTYRFTYTLGNISLAGTVWMTVILAIDRYVAIVYPFNDFTRDQQRRGCKVFCVIIGVSALTVIFGIPYAFEIKTDWCAKGNSSRSPVVGPSELRNNWYYQIVYRIVCGILLHSFVPMLLLIFLLLRISIEVYRAKQRRRRMSAQSIASAKTKVVQNGHSSMLLRLPRKRKNRLGPTTDNLMLLFVAMKFLLTRSLTVLLNIAEIVLGRQKFNASFALLRVIDVSNFLVIFNSATNIVVYMIVGRRFRREIVKTLCCLKRRSPENSETANNNNNTDSKFCSSRRRNGTRLPSNGTRTSSICFSHQSPTSADSRRKKCQIEMKFLLEEERTHLLFNSNPALRGNYKSLLSVLNDDDQSRLSSF